jgi:WD40 repeat protein
MNGGLLREFIGHNKEINQVVFSPDGKWLATASVDGTSKIYDVNTGSLILTISGHSDNVEGIAFFSDSKHIVTASQDGTIKFWEIVPSK